MGVGSRQTHGRVEWCEEGVAIKNGSQTDCVVMKSYIVARLVRGMMGGDDTAKSGDRNGAVGCHTEYLFREVSEMLVLMRMICSRVGFLYTASLSPRVSPTVT